MQKAILLMLALLLAAAIAGRAQDGAAAMQQAAEPQQGDEAQAADVVTPDASTSDLSGSAEQAAAGQSSGGSDVASQQPAQEAAGEQSSDAQPAQQKDAFTAEQLEILQQQIQQAIESQQNREEVTGRVYAQLVAEAPAAELASGDADVSTTGACAAAYDVFCASVKPGEGRFAECLSEQLHQEQLGNVQGVTVSPSCVAELEAFKVDRSTNINKDIPLARACMRDARHYCAQHGHNTGAVLACLRTVSSKLTPRCQQEVFRTQVEAAKDYRTDTQLAQYCQGDADKLCSDVTPGEGRIQECLRQNAGKVSFDCKQELFRQDVENADDVRLSVQLMRLCTGETQVFCRNVEPGNAHVMECLEDHRSEDGFGVDCRTQLESVMERRAMDFRLDAPLREACEADIDKLCGLPFSRLDSVQGFDGKVVRCLQDFRDELTVPECQLQVHRTLERSAEDIRFNYPLANDCAEDRKLLCPDAQPGSARVIQCLQEGRDQLGVYCKAALFDFEQDMAENIDFKAPLKAACAGEISAFCDGVPHGHARIIRCLQDKLDDEAMGHECRDKVIADVERSSTDYRLNFRLRDACEEDLSELCPNLCKEATKHACGGRALRCLTDNAEQIRSKSCRDEVFYFEKMEVFDYRNDVILAETCREDVNKFCKKVETGEGRVHECLRQHQSKLSERCRKEELHLSIMQAQDIRLRPKLRKACSQEIAVYCKSVKPGQGRIMRCLQENLGQPNFGQPCAQQMVEREAAMQADWHEDYGVAAACADSVQQLCQQEEGQAHGKAAVLRCLLSQLDTLDGACEQEVSRAARMALWEYTPGAALTEVCDLDVSEVCGEAGANHKRGVFTIGAVGRCLAQHLARGTPLEPQCWELVMAAAPSDSRAALMASSAQQALQAKVKELQMRAKAAATANEALVKAKLVNPEAQGASIITLSGWIAAAAIAAMVMVVLVGVYAGLRRLLSPRRPYTVVATRDGDD